MPKTVKICGEQKLPNEKNWDCAQGTDVYFVSKYVWSSCNLEGTIHSRCLGHTDKLNTDLLDLKEHTLKRTLACARPIEMMCTCYLIWSSCGPLKLGNVPKRCGECSSGCQCSFLLSTWDQWFMPASEVSVSGGH